MLSCFSRVSVILSAAKDPQLNADHEKRILRSFLPQDDTPALMGASEGRSNYV